MQAVGYVLAVIFALIWIGLVIAEKVQVRKQKLKNQHTDDNIDDFIIDVKSE